MKKKISLDNIGFIIIILTIIILNIFIGSNVKNPIWIVQFIVSAYTAIYVLINIIKKKKNIIIKNKIDIFVLMFMFSTILPFIFKNYASLNGTINFILKYWSVYGMYILVRNIVTNKNKVQIIINAFIISSIIPIIFGIDKLTYNIFEPFLDLINAFKSIEVTRMVSTFGYANTFAIYLATMGSLAISQLINTNKKTAKVLYAIYIIVAGICIMLTQSKAVIALIIVILFSFMIIGIKKKKINKKIIIVIIIFIILFFIYFFIAIRIGKPAQITGEEKTFVIRNFEPNKQYEFTMDIDAESDIMGVVIGTIMAETIILVYETISVRNKLNIKKFIKAFLNFLVKGIIMFVIIYSMRNIIDNKIILIVMQCVVGFAIYILLNKKYVFSIIR